MAPGHRRQDILVEVTPAADKERERIEVVLATGRERMIRRPSIRRTRWARPHVALEAPPSLKSCPGSSALERLDNGLTVCLLDNRQAPIVTSASSTAPARATSRPGTAASPTSSST